MSTKRTTWQVILIRMLCVLMLIQGTPLLALQGGAVTVRSDPPAWLQEIMPSWPWIVWQSAPSVLSSSTSPTGGGGSSPEPALSPAEVEKPQTDWTTVRGAANLAHSEAREATPQPAARQLAQRFTKANREAGSAHNPSRERLPEGAQTKVEPRVEVPTKGIPSALLNLVEELHRSPSEVFAYLHDNFDFDPRWGAAKPPLQTLREKRGTAWELTWLLRDLLAALGLDARFEWGEIELSPKGLESITGIDDVYRAADLIATGGTPIRLIIEDDEVAAVRMRHVWLLAYLDYVPNRGRWVGEPDYWVRMGPTFKRYEVDEGARLDDAVPFALGDYLQSGSELSPRDVYEEALEVHLSENVVGVDTVDGVKRDRVPLKEDFVFVPGSLRGYVRNVEGASIGIPAEFMNRLELRLSEVGGSDLMSWSTDLASLYAKPLEIAWTGASSADQAALDLNGGVFATPPYEVELAAKLRLGDAEVATGGAVGSAADVLLTAVVTSPDGEPLTTEFAMFAGEHAVLAADLGLVPQEVVDLYGRRQSDATEAQEIERWALAHASALYLHELGENNAHLSGLRWQRLVNLGNVVLAVQRGAVSRSPDGTPLTFSPAPPALDLGAMTLALFPPTGDPASEVSAVGTMELLGSQASMLEAEVWAAVLGGEHVSAVPALTRAVREGQTLTRVDAINLDTALSAAELSAEAEASVEIGVAQGRIAWIPESQIRVGTWDVTGYVLENPTTGAAGYLATYERILEPLDANLVIHSPLDLEVVTAPTDVVATIEGEAVESWTLSTRPAGSESMTETARGNGPITNAVLGQFDPTLLLNGMHELVLTARDGSGRSATRTISLSVEGNMKIGHFTLSYIDLAIPLSGLDLEIVRTYDSRNRTQQDFGVGWFLEIRQGSYRNNRPPGEGWQLAEGFLPCDSAVETKSHVTTIRLSEREVYRFALRLSNGVASAGGGCFATAAFAYVDGPTSRAILEIVGNDQVFQETQSSDRVLDLDTLATYEPRTVRLTTRDGRIFDLDLAKGVTRLEDANGNALEISPEAIAHSAGLQVEMTRGADGQIESMTDPNGRHLTYRRDARGDLTEVVDRGGNTTQFRYDERHLIVDLVDPLGRVPVRNEYDDSGRLTRHIDAFGKTFEFAHDLAGQREVVTNRLGHSRILEYDGRGNVVREIDELGQVSVRTFDNDDNLLTETDPLGRTTVNTYTPSNDLASRTNALDETISYTYNTRGRRLTTTDALGRVTAHTYDDAGNRTSTTDAQGHVTSFTYDGSGNRLTETDALGNTTSWTYDTFGNPRSEMDAIGNVRSFTYDNQGNRLTESRARTLPNGELETLVTAFTYDDLDRLIETRWPDGSTTSVTYDALGRVVRRTDALGRATALTYDELGRLTQTTYPDGTVETQTHDAEGRLVMRTDRAGRATSFTQDAAGRLIRTTFADGTSTTKAYDLAGQLLRSTDARGNTTRFSYDALGRRSSSTDALGNTETLGYDAVGNQVRAVDSVGATTSRTYDAMGRVTRITFPDATAINMRYDAAGRRVAEIDPAGLEKRFGYDALGRLVEVQDALGQRTLYTYDEVGNRLTQTDANGHTTRFEHDRRGRRLARVFPDGARETMAYVADGTLVSHTDFLGRTTAFEHDSNGRMTRRIHPDGTEVTWTYTPTGRRATVTDIRGVTAYSYDDRDRLTSKTDPTGDSLAYTYDAVGNRTSMTATVGASVLTTSYRYDALNRPSGMTDSQGGAYTLSFDANDNAQSIAFPNGVTTSHTFDALNRLTQLETTDAAGVVLQRYALTLGPSGNRTRIDELDGTSRSYSYDAFYRLLEDRVTGAAGDLVYRESFTYDPVSNRLSLQREDAGGTVTESASSFDVRDRLLAVGTERTYAWDSNGNLTSAAEHGASTGYAWDTQNRLIGVTQPDGTHLRTVYDADGIRVATEQIAADGVTVLSRTDYLVDTSGSLSHVVGEIVGGEVQVSYARVGDQLLGVYRPASAESRYYHADALGSIRLLTDETGAVTDRYTYTAYGEEIAHVGSDPQPYRFAGEPFDAVTGWSYNRARWLDPTVGRFVSVDPFGGFVQEPVSLHRYLYANADPAGTVDPTGRVSAFAAGLAVTLTVAGFLLISSPLGVYPPFFNSEPAVVHIWTFRGKNEAWGHASLTLSDGTHISWWPNNQNVTSISKLPNVWCASAFENQTFEVDVKLEERDPDIQIQVGCLNEIAIKQWWRDFQISNDWCTLSQNCSTTVYDALRAGGAPFEPQAMWTPASVERYADSLSRRCGQ